mmetsp:Transcript_26386/g.68737  ORF Transcript_26386/g.68737 Transcript_26386/m.68737 type:complete len:227 (+) Transcript_26386:405-1085(+)
MCSEVDRQVNEVVLAGKALGVHELEQHRSCEAARKTPQHDGHALPLAALRGVRSRKPLASRAPRWSDIAGGMGVAAGAAGAGGARHVAARRGYCHHIRPRGAHSDGILGLRGRGCGLEGVRDVAHWHDEGLHARHLLLPTKLQLLLLLLLLHTLLAIALLNDRLQVLAGSDAPAHVACARLLKGVEGHDTLEARLCAIVVSTVLLVVLLLAHHFSSRRLLEHRSGH